MDDTTAPIGRLAIEALDLLVASVEQTPPNCWDQPSNLGDWTVRELVGHATGSAAKIVTLIEDGHSWGRSEPADWVSEQPATRLRELARRLRDALPGADMAAPRMSPHGEVPLHRALSFSVADLALHSWDLRCSQGHLVELPDALLAFCQGLVESVPQDVLRQPGRFGPARTAPDGSTPTVRLMAYLGRSVDARG